jgi:hypothetical protein
MHASYTVCCCCAMLRPAAGATPSAAAAACSAAARRARIAAVPHCLTHRTAGSRDVNVGNAPWPATHTRPQVPGQPSAVIADETVACSAAFCGGFAGHSHAGGTLACCESPHGRSVARCSCCARCDAAAGRQDQQQQVGRHQLRATRQKPCVDQVQKAYRTTLKGNAQLAVSADFRRTLDSNSG